MHLCLHELFVFGGMHEAQELVKSTGRQAEMQDEMHFFKERDEDMRREEASQARATPVRFTRSRCFHHASRSHRLRCSIPFLFFFSEVRTVLMGATH